jgi:ABC-type Na+ efflux pump permease subunit
VGFVWSTAVKDLRRHRRDPLSVLLWIGIPLVVGLLIILAAGGDEGPRPRARLLVADEDDTLLSRFLVGALSQDAAGGFIEAEPVEREAGEVRMEEGEATALLVIPDGFADAVLREEPATLRLVTNPSQRILPGIVEEGLTILVDGVFYLHRLIGDDLRAFAEGPPGGLDTFPNEQIAAFSVRVNELMDRLGDLLFPPIITVESGTGEPEGEPGEEEAGVGVLLLPGILFMALLFMAQGLSADLWEEREARTLRRAAVTPSSLHAFLAGKVLAGVILIFGVSLVGLSAGYAYLSLSPRTLLPAAAWSTLSGVALMAMLTMVQLFASSRRMGHTLTMVVIFPLMMVGGSFFPFEAMPGWMAAIGRLTPNGWALEQLKAILTGRAEAGSVAAAGAGLAAVSGLLFRVASWRLGGAFMRE